MAYTSLNPFFDTVRFPTTTLTTGIIYFGGAPFIHEFGTATSTFIGANAGNLTNTGTENTAIGSGSLNAITSGQVNTALGQNSLPVLTSGFNNTGCGQTTLFSLTGGNNTTTSVANTAVGAAAGQNLVSGAYNILVGGSTNGTAVGSAGFAYTGAESSNICIGSAGVTGDGNTIRIGSQGGTLGAQNKCFIAGITGVTVASSAPVLINTGTGQLGTVASTKRLKDNIKPLGETNVMNLKPMTFTFKSDSTKEKQFGLIAEEVIKEMPELVTLDEDGQPYHVAYHVLPTLLLAELQKMSKRLDALEKKK